MTFLEHLEELRWHLIRITLAILIVGIVVFIYVREFTDQILLAPYSSDFPTHQLLCELDPSVCFNNSPLSEAGFSTSPKSFYFQANSPTEEFMRAMVVAFFAGLVVTFPYTCWELWRFIKPGLRSKEIRAARGFVFFTSLLFASGIVFAYYVVVPFSVSFLTNFSISENVVKLWKISDVIELIVLICLTGGILFQLPVLAFFLSRIGIVTPQLMRSYRRHSIVGIFVISAILTPADVMSQIVLAAPLLILYEMSIFVSSYVYKQKAKEELEEIKKMREANLSNSQ